MWQTVQSYVQSASAATGPWGLVGYALAGLVLVFAISGIVKVRRVKHLAEGSSDDVRRELIQREYSTVPRAGISAEQWLLDRQRNRFLWAGGGILLALLVFGLTWLTNPTPIPAQLDPPPNPLRKVDSKSVPSGVAPKTIGAVKLVRLDQDTLEVGQAKFARMKVVLQNADNKPVILNRISVFVETPIYQGGPPQTGVLKPISSLIVPLNEWNKAQDNFYELQDPIQIGAGDSTTLELVFCAACRADQPVSQAGKQDEIDIRVITRGSTNLKLTSMVGGIVACLKFIFDDKNVVVTDTLEIK